MGEFRLEDFALTPEQVEVIHAYQAKHRPARSAPPSPSPFRVTGRFLYGPVSMEWLWEAKQAGLRALWAGLELWVLHGMRRRRRTLKGNPKEIPLNISAIARQLGTDRQSVSQGLQALIRAGLVVVRRRSGGRSVVVLQRTREVSKGDGP